MGRPAARRTSARPLWANGITNAGVPITIAGNGRAGPTMRPTGPDLAMWIKSVI
jgi:hypothetical protein